MPRAGNPDGSTAPVARVGGADKEGKCWIDWNNGGATPEIIKGPQGGQHIWVSADTLNLHPKKARIAVTMYVEQPDGSSEMVKPGRVEMTGTLKFPPAPGERGSCGQLPSDLYYFGLPAFVKDPCKIAGKKVRVELEVDDLYGVHAESKAWITPTWNGYCDPLPP